MYMHFRHDIQNASRRTRVHCVACAAHAFNKQEKQCRSVWLRSNQSEKLKKLVQATKEEQVRTFNRKHL